MSGSLAAVASDSQAAAASNGPAAAASGRPDASASGAPKEGGQGVVPKSSPREPEVAGMAPRVAKAQVAPNNISFTELSGVVTVTGALQCAPQFTVTPGAHCGDRHGDPSMYLQGHRHGRRAQNAPSTPA